MNIQANLIQSNLLVPAKNVANNRLANNDNVEKKSADSSASSTLIQAKKSNRAELFEHIELLDKKQSLTSHTQALDYKSQKTIQSYLDNQALADQPLRDELHEQLGIDLLA
ncbi:MAG: hypothetical protein KBT50_09055 [Cycloclasticus sp.]|nr:hypothetical protein [Cycloclasticus sp.]MBQ0790752.1 hypothetical protein [Cycloclasticus sp.]